MELARRDQGSTSSIGLIIAAVTIAGSFLTAQLMVAPPSGLDTRGSALHLQAATALDLVIGGEGETTTGADWALDADVMTRFGLASAGEPNFLDYEKIKALRNGSTTTSGANRAPDYPEVRSALGLADADFHLRSYPVMPGVDDPRWAKDASGRLAYFAHYSGATAPVTLGYAATMEATALNVSVTVTNAALIPAIYVVVLGLGDQDSGAVVVSEERHTRLLAPGDSQTVWQTWHRLPSWSATIDAVKVEVIDPYGNVAVGTTGVTIGSFWFGQPPPSGGSSSYGLLASADSVYYTSGDQVKFNVDHHDGSGAKVNGAQARFVLLGPDGKEWTNQTVSLPKTKNSMYTYACTNCTAVGNYTAKVWDTGMTRLHVDQVHVAAARMFTEKATLAPVALREMSLLTDLVGSFDATRFDPTTNLGGDVFGDDTNGPSELTDVLSRYTTLVVGSEVAQTALTPANTKHAIAEWVQAGGNLLVLGTYTQQSRWLEPIYHAAQENANGGISAPDPTHPVLSSPNELEYDRYLDRGRAWRISDGAEFTHVLSRGAQANGDVDDTLAVSAPGALGNGTVVLTSYMPGSLTEPQDDMEAKRLLHNLMSQGYTMLFLDYGPPIPPSVPVGSASRLVAVEHPNVPGAVVEIKLVLYLFG